MNRTWGGADEGLGTGGALWTLFLARISANKLL